MQKNKILLQIHNCTEFRQNPSTSKPFNVRTLHNLTVSPVTHSHEIARISTSHESTLEEKSIRIAEGSEEDLKSKI